MSYEFQKKIGDLNHYDYLFNVQVFDFDLSGKEIGPEDCIEVTVKDYEKIGRNRLLGSASIPIGSLLQEANKEFSATLNDGQGRATTVCFILHYFGPALLAYVTSSVSRSHKF